MKKMIALSTATLLLVAFLLSMPSLMDRIVTSVTLVRPECREISDDIYISGSIEEQSKKDVTVQLPLVPGAVAVSVGDPVEAGQVLASVDVEATRSAILKLLEAAELIPDEYVSAMGDISQIGEIEGISSLYADTNVLDTLIPTEITAPASGTVTALSLVSGAISQPRAAVCTISQMDSLRVRISVEETSADRIETGDTVVFKASATGNTKYSGQIRNVFPTATKTLVGTSQQTVVGAYADINGDAARLKPGYSVNGVIKKNSGQTALVVPYDTVQQDDDNQEYVYLYENARAVRRDITTGTEFATGVAVTSGLGLEDLVISNASDVPGDNSLVLYVEQNH